MTDEDLRTPGFLEQVRDRFAMLDMPRRSGYIGQIPYLQILRWFTVLAIVLRLFLHLPEYQGHLSAIVVTIVAAVVLAAVLTAVPIRPRLPATAWKALAVVGLDIAVVSVAYLCTGQVQSDMYLLFFLPLLTAAEYVGLRWVTAAFLSVGIAFATVIYRNHLVDATTNFTLEQLFLRVYIGREAFLFGLIAMTWYLIQVERRQQNRLGHALEDLDHLSGEAKALFTFSSRLDQLFLGQDLVREAVQLATQAAQVNWGLGVLYQDDGRIWHFRYDRGAPKIAALEEILRAVESGGTPAKREDYALELLEVGHRRLGLLAVGVLPGGRLPNSIHAFLEALTGPLLNGLRRSLLVSAVRNVNRATIRASEFDSELDDTLRQVTDELQMEFGTITLKDDYRGIVEMVRGRNVPPGLLRRSRYHIGDRNIQTHVIAHGQTTVLERNNELFNQEIFEFFEQHKVARIWVPLRSDGKIIGTIEAGCSREREAEAFTPEIRGALEVLATRKGPLLDASSPQSLLNFIAREAIRLIAADSAAIHVFQAAKPFPAERLNTITQEEFATLFHQKEPVLAAGAGNAAPEFIRKHVPRPNGIGWKAIMTASRGDSDAHQCVGSAEFQTTHPQMHAEGVRAILAMPLRVRPDIVGVLYVHYWSPHEFTTQEVQIERVFAAQIEVAIQSYFLLRDTALAVHNSRSLLDWLKVMQSAAKLRQPTSVLEELAQTLLLLADASNVVLYQYVTERCEFLAPPLLKGTFADRDAMCMDVNYEHLVYRLLGEKLPVFYDVIEDRSEIAVRDPTWQRFVKREQVRSCAILELRAHPGDELFGVLFVNYRNQQHFTAEQRTTMQALASSAAGVIRTARFYEWLNKRQAHIDSLREIDAAIVSNARELNLDAILSAILSEAMLICRSWAGAIFMRNGRDQLEARVALPSANLSTFTLESGTIGRCAGTAEVQSVTKALGTHMAVRSGSKSCLAVPLLDADECRGVLYLESDREGAFADEDARILETLAVQAVIALHTIESHRKLELERSRALALSLVATSIQNSEYSLDLHLYIILTGITAGESLGFSRAMLFERPEGGDVLRGRTAVGEMTPEGARAAWEGVGSQSVERAIETAIHHFESGHAESGALMDAIRNLEIPLTSGGGALSECVISRAKPCRYVAQNEDDYFRHFVATDQSVPFACIPLVGRREVVGVLVVDNRFQLREAETISEEMIGRVAPYAELAAMSIEAARLVDKTQTQSYEDLAHQLRTPIYMAGRYCDALVDDSVACPNSTSAVRSLKACIDSAIHISERLQDYTELAKGKKLNSKLNPVSARAILRMAQDAATSFEILCKSSRRVEVRANEFSELADLSLVSDIRLMREALETLLENAVRYSFPGTVINVGVALTGEPAGFELYVENLGLDIKPEEIDLLAQRGWRGPATHSVASSGSGIGLWVAEGIMRTLNGHLRAVASTPDHRTHIGLWFPASQQAGSIMSPKQ